jgi:hypothetical protein
MMVMAGLAFLASALAGIWLMALILLDSGIAVRTFAFVLWFATVITAMGTGAIRLIIHRRSHLLLPFVMIASFSAWLSFVILVGLVMGPLGLVLFPLFILNSAIPYLALRLCLWRRADPDPQ